jgi:nicotinamidase-related amidase
MPVTTLDHKTALIVIDLQKGITTMAAATGADLVIEKAATLAAAFRQHGLPVVLVNVAGVAPGRADQVRRIQDVPSDWAVLEPALNQQPQDITVTKHSWGAFTATDLESKLNALGVTQVVLAGISTSIGVETTARQAYEMGLNVTFALDAMTDLNMDAHANSIHRIFPRLGENGSTADILALLSN